MAKAGGATNWIPNLKTADGPVYLAIADAIAADIASGRFASGGRLPPQRALADALGIDFTTVTRAYAEARKRGLVEGRVGQGTYIRLKRLETSVATREVDVSMNLPPRFGDAALQARMERAVAEIVAEGPDLFLSYQDPAGAAVDRQAARIWLERRLPEVSADHIVVCPGTQGGIVAALSLLARRGDVVCVESVSYPGFLALASQLGIQLAPIAMDGEGLLPDSFRSACRQHQPKALYLTPTLQNPTTATMSLARRKQIVEVARRENVPIIEDDAYGALPHDPFPPLAAIAPDRVYHIAGLSKCLSPALRVAYLVLPKARLAVRAANAVRAFAGMTSPLTAAIATRWIEDGIADAVLASIRSETAKRLSATRKLLPDAVTKPDCFHAWLPLPAGWQAGALVSRAQSTGVGLVAGDAFAVGPAPQAVRISLGAPRHIDDLVRGLEIIGELVNETSGSASLIV